MDEIPGVDLILAAVSFDANLLVVPYTESCTTLVDVSESRTF